MRILLSTNNSNPTCHLKKGKRKRKKERIEKIYKEKRKNIFINMVMTSEAWFLPLPTYSFDMLEYVWEKLVMYHTVLAKKKKKKIWTKNSSIS